MEQAQCSVSTDEELSSAQSANSSYQMFEDDQTTCKLNNNPDEGVKDKIWNHDSRVKALKFDPQTGKLHETFFFSTAVNT